MVARICNDRRHHVAGARLDHRDRIAGAIRHPDVGAIEYGELRTRSDGYRLEVVAAGIELQQRPGTEVGDPDVRTVIENASWPCEPRGDCGYGIAD